MEEFFLRGYSGAPIDSIAARAGVSKGTIYLYFKSKEDLFLSLIDAIALPYVAELEAIIRSAADAQALVKSVSYSATYLRDTPLPKLLRVVVASAFEFPGAAAHCRIAVFERVRGVLTEAIEHAAPLVTSDRGRAAKIAQLALSHVVSPALWFEVFQDSGEEEDALLALQERALMNALSYCPTHHGDYHPDDGSARVN